MGLEWGNQAGQGKTNPCWVSGSPGIDVRATEAAMPDWELGIENLLFAIWCTGVGFPGIKEGRRPDGRERQRSPETRGFPVAVFAFISRISEANSCRFASF